jgi:hypothetical protein
MIHNSLKRFIFSFMLLSCLMMYSQPGNNTSGGDLEGDDAYGNPGTNTVSGDLESEDAPATPINDKLIILALAGIVFGVYTFRNNRERA